MALMAHVKNNCLAKCHKVGTSKSVWECCRETVGDVHVNVASTSEQSLEDANTSANNENDLVIPRTMKLMRGSSRDAVGSLKEMQDFELLELLGQGFFGMVYKVREKQLYADDCLADSGVMVMKIPILHNHSCRLSAKKIVIKEDYMLRRLEHPNILKSRGICVQRLSTQWQLNLLVDFCDAGSLQQLILNIAHTFPWLQRCKVALDVCRAMNYVHSQGFMHRDLTSMNILLKSQAHSSFPNAVVADFGLSSKIPQYPNILQQVGTQNWMAPEMLKEEFYNEKSDVFSFGIIMCQMIARIDADHDAGLYRTAMFGLDYVRFIARCPTETPLTLLKIAFMCCVWNPDSRPSFENLMNQFNELVNQNRNQNTFPRENVPTPEEIRLGRSRSDAAIRGTHSLDHFSSSSPVTQDTPSRHTSRRKCGWKLRTPNPVSSRQQNGLNSLGEEIPEQRKSSIASSIKSVVIHEGIIHDHDNESCVPGLLPFVFDDGDEEEEAKITALKKCEDEKASNRLKALATSVASRDPNYQESEENPFSTHVRYRSIRKMKPSDSSPNSLLSTLRLSLTSGTSETTLTGKTKNSCDDQPSTSISASCEDNLRCGKTLNVETSNVRMQNNLTNLEIQNKIGESSAKDFSRTSRRAATKEKTGDRQPKWRFEKFRSLSLPSSFAFHLEDLPQYSMDSSFMVVDHSNSPNESTQTTNSTILNRKWKKGFFKSDVCSTILKKKMSVTLGLGEQRDLQGRITLSFRDYDDKFTSGKYLRCRKTAVMNEQSPLLPISHIDIFEKELKKPIETNGNDFTSESFDHLMSQNGNSTALDSSYSSSSSSSASSFYTDANEEDLKLVSDKMENLPPNKNLSANIRNVANGGKINGSLTINSTAFESESNSTKFHSENFSANSEKDERKVDQNCCVI